MPNLEKFQNFLKNNFEKRYFFRTLISVHSLVGIKKIVESGGITKHDFHQYNPNTDIRLLFSFYNFFFNFTT